jgi:hypothetical protein
VTSNKRPQQQARLARWRRDSADTARHPCFFLSLNRVLRFACCDVTWQHRLIASKALDVRGKGGLTLPSYQRETRGNRSLNTTVALSHANKRTLMPCLRYMLCADTRFLRRSLRYFT